MWGCKSDNFSKEHKKLACWIQHPVLILAKQMPVLWPNRQRSAYLQFSAIQRHNLPVILHLDHYCLHCDNSSPRSQAETFLFTSWHLELGILGVGLGLFFITNQTKEAKLERCLSLHTTWMNIKMVNMSVKWCSLGQKPSSITYTQMGSELIPSICVWIAI